MKLKTVFFCDIILFFALCSMYSIKVNPFACSKVFFSILFFPADRLCYSIDPEYHLLNRLNQIPNAFVNSIINILGLKYHPIEEDVTFWCAKT